MSDVDPSSGSAGYRRWIESNRALIAHGIYTLAAVLSLSIAYFLRFEFAVPVGQRDNLIRAIPILLGVRLAANGGLRLAAGRWRFVGVEDVRRLVMSATLGTALFSGLITLLPGLPRVPRSIFFLEWMLWIFVVASIWIFYRVAFEYTQRRSNGSGLTIRSLIVGAGDAGSLLAREIARIPSGRRVVGFVDDDPFKWGTHLRGIEVFGGTRDLSQIATAARADEIIIAIPSAPPEALRKIVERCEATDLSFKVLPGIAQVLSGSVSAAQLREVRIEDLLGRDPVRLELPELADDLEGETCFITGAAGSIGSELARQVAVHRPARLVLYDRAESEMYFLERSLRNRFPELDLHLVVGDILDDERLRAQLERFDPSRLYHAAAYKHVPLMETNVREAIRNNVLGTWRVARAAGEHGVEKMVLISTDKAVRPSSVMGATKRVAEQVVMSAAEAYPGTAFVAVRFGNVLGSNGSVIPIFRDQLQAGEPLTVTHQDATRFFMTIPEAVQLVLQASVLPGARGHIAMLEMGEPVKIVDLAKNLIRLSGLRIGVDAEIVFTGLRPGEKLHEELAAPYEKSVETPVEKIRLLFTDLDRSHRKLLEDLGRVEAFLGDCDDRSAFLALVGLLDVRDQENFQEADAPELASQI